MSKDTFERVQAVLDSHNRAGEKQRVHRHYLKGSVSAASAAAGCAS